MRALAWMLSERVCYSERSRVCAALGSGMAVSRSRTSSTHLRSQQVATAQGEDADLLLAAVGVQFDQRGHGVGEFV